MPRHALQVISDDPRSYGWVVHAPTEDWDRFIAHSSAECDFDSYEAALNAGFRAVAKADGEGHENETAEPVVMRTVQQRSRSWAEALDLRVVDGG